jgi:hypothetical protein
MPLRGCVAPLDRLAVRDSCTPPLRPSRAHRPDNAPPATGLSWLFLYRTEDYQRLRQRIDLAKKKSAFERRRHPRASGPRHLRVGAGALRLASSAPLHVRLCGSLPRAARSGEGEGEGPREGD